MRKFYFSVKMNRDNLHVDALARNDSSLLSDFTSFAFESIADCMVSAKEYLEYLKMQMHEMFPDMEYIVTAIGNPQMLSDGELIIDEDALSISKEIAAASNFKFQTEENEAYWNGKDRKILMYVFTYTTSGWIGIDLPVTAYIAETDEDDSGMQHEIDIGTSIFINNSSAIH